MKKRILSLLMAVVLAVSLLPAMSVPAEAAGESFTLDFRNGEITNLADFTTAIANNNITTVTLNNTGYQKVRLYASAPTYQSWEKLDVHTGRDLSRGNSDTFNVPSDYTITGASSSGSSYEGYTVEIDLKWNEIGYELFQTDEYYNKIDPKTKEYTAITAGSLTVGKGWSTTFGLTPAAKSAGYQITKVVITNFNGMSTVTDTYKSWSTDKGTLSYVDKGLSVYSTVTVSGVNSDSVTLKLNTRTGTVNYHQARVYYAPHSHTYGGWSTDGTNHWHQCTASYCTNRTGSIKDKAAHTGGAATCTAKAKCSTCGAEYGSAGSHNWGYTASGNVITATCSRVNTHKATLTLTASDSTYNGAAKPATIGNWTGTTAGLAAKPTTVTYKGTNGTSYNSTTAPTNAGSYTASITVGSATATKAFTIAKANLSPTVTLNGWTYGGAANNPSVTGNTGNGTVTYTYKAQGAEDSTYTATQPSDAGNYTVKASIAATTNYNAATATKAFTIAKANASLTPPTANELTYNGEAQELVTEGTNVVGGTLKYRLDGGNYSENIPTAINAGTYTVHYKVSGDANYNDTTEASVPVTIAKADPTVTPPQAVQGLVYTGTPQALVTAGSADGGTMEYMEYSTSQNGEYTDSIPEATDAGTYTVWYKVKGDTNYNGTEAASVSVTIAKAYATNDMKTEEVYLRAVHGETAVIELDPLPDEIASYGAITNNNTDYFTLSAISTESGYGVITAYTADTCPNASGTKTFTVPVTGSKNYENYEIKVTVNLVELPVQTIEAAHTLNVTYGDTDKSVSADNTTTEGDTDYKGAIKYHVLDEDGGTSVIEVNEGTGALTIKSVGTAVVVAQAARSEGYYAPSEPVHITVHVAPKALTDSMLTLTDSTFTYNGNEQGPAFTVKDGSTELTHTDYGVDITSTTSAVNAGTYKIKIDGIVNYTGSVEKTWEIQKVKATVTPPTANDRTYDGTEQALVNAGTDVVGGTLKYRLDGGEYDTDIPTATNAGTYHVWYKVEGDHNHNDVAATKIPVTIAKATPTITTPLTADEITYGQTLSASTLTGVASTDGSFAWKEPGKAPVVSDSDTTNYTVVFTPDDTTNYETVECNATLTVNKKPVDAVIDITAPKAKETAQTELAATDDFEAATITWSPELKDGKFEYNKEYTATVTLNLKDIENTTIDDVTFTVDGAKADGVTFEDGTMTLKVVFTNTGSAPGSPSNSITAPGSAENGEVSVDKKSASAGQTVTITVTPDKGYTLETLTVTDAKGNEVALTKVDDTTYTFKMPSGKVNVDATFMEDNTMLNYFVDVPVNEYYYDAVLWAVSNGITNGTDDTHFSPNMGTTRAHVVTFLWRAAGCPEPKGDASQFTDVVAGEYYEKAVAWAIENGITKGTSATTFSPDAICTRGQIVTFLARFAGVKDEAVGYTHGFTDVNAADYFNNAVAWAKDNKITEGTTATTFSPYEDCTRAQVVTFLYRLLNK